MTTTERSDGMNAEELEGFLNIVRTQYHAASDKGVLVRLYDEAIADRDRARRVAVALEQQVAAVEAIAQQAYQLGLGNASDYDIGRGRVSAEILRALSPSDEKDGDEG